jgi:hypothetical protein
MAAVFDGTVMAATPNNRAFGAALAIVGLPYGERRLACGSRSQRNASRGFRVPISEKISERDMYPWPTGNFNYIIVMDDSLHIALHYLDRSGHAARFQDVQSAAAAIVGAWERGVQHRIKLADIAIKAVRRNAEPLLKQPTCAERSPRSRASV